MRPWITFVFKSTCFLFPWGFLLTLLQKNLLDSLQAFVLIIVQFSRSCVSLSRWQLCYYSSFTTDCQQFFAAFTFFLLFLQLFHHFLGFLQPFSPFSFDFCGFITIFVDFYSINLFLNFSIIFLSCLEICTWVLFKIARVDDCVSSL